MKRLTHPAIAIMLFIVVIGVGIVYALISQAVPSTQVSQTTVLPGCSTLTGPVSTSSGTGAILFTCNGSPAFSTVSGSSTPSSTDYPSCPATGPCYTTFGYVAHGDPTGSCTASTGSGFHAVIIGTGPFQPQSFTGNGSWDYCGVYNAPPAGGTLPGFNIAWS